MQRALAVAVVLALACSGPARDAEPGSRVIALAPSIVRIIQAVGATDHLVGVDAFSKRLVGLEEVPSVGGLYTPDLERTLELKPTLVLAVKSAHQQAALDHLRSRGVRVEEIEPYTLEEHLGSFLRVGALVGREAQAAALVASVREQLAAVERDASTRSLRSVVLVLERDPLYVAGGGAFTDALIRAAGGSNVFGDLDQPYPRVSLEALAERAPDVVIDSSVGAEAGPAALAAARDYWSQFSWVKRVEPLARGAATLPGPDLGLGARLLFERIHPEAVRPEPGT